MTTSFWAAAISRKDGGASDGIHLLWTAPYPSGYSVTGYDIQRRDSMWRPEPNCYTLTPDDLAALHAEMRLATPVGEISVRATPCPRPPGLLPDEPTDDRPNGDGKPSEGAVDLHCIDLTKTPGTHGTIDDADGARFASFDAAGNRDAHVMLRTTGGFRGADCDHRLEIDFPAPTTRVTLSLIQFSRPAKIEAMGAAGVVVATTTTSAPANQPETIELSAVGITRVVIGTPGDETLLLRLCWQRSVETWTETERCTTLGTLDLGDHPNPLVADGVSYTALIGGRASGRTTIRDMSRFTGLDCISELRVALDQPADAVRVVIVTFASPVTVRALRADGSVAASTKTTTRGLGEILVLSGGGITALDIVEPNDEALLLELCVRTTRAAVPHPGGGARVELVEGTATEPATLVPDRVTARTGKSDAPTCLRYRIRLDGAHQLVEVAARAPATLMVAMREGKAVDSRWLHNTNGVQAAAFVGRGVDEVLLYTGQPITALIVCADVALSPADETAEWSAPAVKTIATGIQMPIRAINSALTSAADEAALANSRLLAGETLDAAAFGDMAQTMNENADAGPASPMWHTMRTRADLKDPFIEIRPWPYALSLTAVAAWRRAMGFGYLDAGAGLTAGARYDYRITGHFRRRDVEEHLFAFHTLPTGTLLPTTFYVDRVRFTTSSARTVELYPPVSATALKGVGRKGIRLAPSSFTPSLVIAFDIPVKHIALELEPAVASTLTYTAQSTGFLLGIAVTTSSGSVAVASRTELEFTDPVDTIELRGDTLLYGVRILGGAPSNPDELLDLSVIVPNVAYATTAAPPPPSALGTINLSEPVLPGDPNVTTQSPPQPMGFHLSWESPAPSGGALPVWPPDLAAVPPSDVLGFHVERRRIDTGDPFEDLDQEPEPTLLFGNRGAAGDPPALYYGRDVLEAYPEIRPPRPPVDPWITVDDVLLAASRPNGPPPGSLHQYRVFSVDAIGRRSATATDGSIVRLEKHVAPPRPPGPGDTPPAGSTRPAGVRARVLQKSDPDLPPADVALLGTHTNAVVLEWGWGAEERARDPYAREFRVYWQTLPPDIVHGTLSGGAALVGGYYEMACALDQALPADAMKGTYLRAPAYPFKVASHTAGTNITIRLEPSALHPGAIPDAATFEFAPILTGAELRPSAWTERSAVIPITPTAPEPYLFFDRLVVDAAHPQVRVWVGVTAADDQWYVPDELPAAAQNGGRPGNESSVAPAIADARYIGRPTFTVPTPLADVPEDVSPEPVGPSVSVRLDLPTLLPTIAVPGGHTVVLDRLELGSIAAALSQRGDGTIGVLFPDRTSASYTLANPGDQAALRQQIAAGEIARIENRFLMDALLTNAAKFESLWTRALPAAVAFGAVTAVLPSKAERWVHRVRLVDPAGHISSTAAIVPRLLRVASTRTPGAPELAMTSSTTDTLSLTARARPAYDLKWLVLFSEVTAATAPMDDRVKLKAQLLRVPDRRDLYPNDGLRLRLADGTLLAPSTAVDVATTGVLEVPDVRIPATLTPGFDKRAAVWAVSMTRDGMPSRVAGPLMATTGQTPLVVPTLAIVGAASGDTASWGTLAVTAEISLERSTDGGATWLRVSPWLPSTTSTFTVAGSGARLYRLVLRRGSEQPHVAGAAVPVT